MQANIIPDKVFYSMQQLTGDLKYERNLYALVTYKMWSYQTHQCKPWSHNDLSCKYNIFKMHPDMYITNK